MRRLLGILIGAVVLGLAVAWFVMSMVPEDEQLVIEKPKGGAYEGAPPNAEKYAPPTKK